MTRTIHNLVQGSQEWHSFRAQHFTASEAAAMLGVSAYQKRSDLLKMKATGYVPEVDSATQRRFNNGHEAEAGARVIAEEEIGEELYPITASRVVDGLQLSASYDGATLTEEVIWEHKLGNIVLIESLANGVIPEQYHPQLEQQLLVLGAEKALFMASSGDRTSMECVWYRSNPELRARLIAGWKQFREDVANYQPVESTVAAVAAPQIGLPAVSITVNGSIALIDNLGVFGAALTAYVERINKSPETDQDFADLEATVKTLKTAEEALDAAESNALAQTDSIDAMRRTVALYRDTARTNRLLVEKLVKSEKENRRNKILSDAQAAFAAHMATLNKRLGNNYMPVIAPQFTEAMKGLKSLDSMKDKAATELARCKIVANEIADRIQANLETKGLHGYAMLFPDLATLCCKSAEDFQNTVTARITHHEAAEAAKEAATRERIRAEEAARLEREQAAAKAIADAQAAQIAADAAKVARIVTAPDVEYTLATAPPSHQTVAPEPEPIKLSGESVVVPLRQLAPMSTPTLKLGQISERLGFTLTAAFLSELGFEPAARDKSALLFHERNFPQICAALVKHIQGVQDRIAA